MPTAPVVITAAVEGPPDEAALQKMCIAAGATLGDVYGNTGKAFILHRLQGFNYSARFRHWVVLVDLDRDYPCPGAAIADWLPQPAGLMCFRISVRELEAWLLADRERIAEFLRISIDLVPTNPDDSPDPKRELVELARRSRVRAIREDMVPDTAVGQAVGPAYTARLIEFIRDDTHGWRPEVAAQNSRSLKKCMAAIQALVAKPFPGASTR